MPYNQEAMDEQPPQLPKATCGESMFSLPSHCACFNVTHSFQRHLFKDSFFCVAVCSTLPRWLHIHQPTLSLLGIKSYWFLITANALDVKWNYCNIERSRGVGGGLDTACSRVTMNGAPTEICPVNEYLLRLAVANISPPLEDWSVPNSSLVFTR